MCTRKHFLRIIRHDSPRSSFHALHVRTTDLRTCTRQILLLFPQLTSGQLTPVELLSTFCNSKSNNYLFLSKNQCTELFECCSLLWLSEIISNHLVSRTILNLCILLFNLICHPKVTNVDCSSTLTRRLLSIYLQQNA